jgi:hypothetical protein
VIDGDEVDENDPVLELDCDAVTVELPLAVELMEGTKEAVAVWEEETLGLAVVVADAGSVALAVIVCVIVLDAEDPREAVGDTVFVAVVDALAVGAAEGVAVALKLPVSVRVPVAETVPLGEPVAVRVGDSGAVGRFEGVEEKVVHTLSVPEAVWESVAVLLGVPVALALKEPVWVGVLDCV